MKKLLFGAALALGLAVGGTAFLETTTPTDAKVFGIWRTQDNGDTCITPAEKNQSFVTSQEQELILTIDDPAQIEALKMAIFIVYGIPPENLVAFDTQEVYSSTNRPNDLYVVLYHMGCQSQKDNGEYVAFWMPRAEFDNILAISGIKMPAKTEGRDGFEPKFITDPRDEKKLRKN